MKVPLLNKITIWMVKLIIVIVDKLEFINLTLLK